MDKEQLWARFKQYLYYNSYLGFTLDISRVSFPHDYLAKMEGEIQRAYKAMEDLEGGAIANPDENRMVGHYWLRAPHLAPTKQLTQDIEEMIIRIKDFAYKIHNGQILSPDKQPFKYLLVIGIGGSALGPQLVAQALADEDKLAPYFMDNTDPAGFDKIFKELSPNFSQTLVIVISKSGGTKETRNGMLEVKAAFEDIGLNFSRHAVAVTGEGSQLDTYAQEEGWLARFSLWDWIGGRTSVTSVVGLLPLALQGINIDEFLDGAAFSDGLTRKKDTLQNPGALLALMWYFLTEGKGKKDMVILPYKDNLQLLSKYLQQLIMESLGKEKDLGGNIVNQGIAVYGNKGSTDQHAYVQQLLEGVDNSFVTFIQVMLDRQGNSILVEDKATSGDFLLAFLEGTKEALRQKGRNSITISIERVNARSMGALIALYERAVGLYGILININPYHQPGVEAGKKVATQAIKLQQQLFAFLEDHKESSYTVEELATILDIGEKELALKILEHASSNVDHHIRKIKADSYFNSRYYFAK